MYSYIEFGARLLEVQPNHFQLLHRLLVHQLEAVVFERLHFQVLREFANALLHRRLQVAVASSIMSNE